MITDAIHSSIVAAVCRVQREIESVSKDQRNQHGGYQFASTDAIYAALTRRMAEAGLMIMCLEAQPVEIHRVEKEGKDGKPSTVQWGRFQFAFVLATAEATWSDKTSCRTLFIQITGPQTFQAAQSYAEKSYLRSLFKLPTGDLDLDSLAQADDEGAQVSLNGNGKRKSSAEGKRDGSVKLFNKIRKEIAEALNPEHLRHVQKTRAEDWASMPERWAATLDEDYDATMEVLLAKAS